MIRILFAVIASAAISISLCQADVVPVTGGQSNASLNVDALGDTGLSITGYSADVFDPGAGFIGFNVNGRDHATRPTTFTYTVADLLPVTGRVEHSGSIFLNSTNPNLGTGPKEMGNFSIGYDTLRASTTTSGFFLESKVGVTGILFDFAGNGTPLIIDGVALFPPDETKIQVQSFLSISPEFAVMLGDSGLAGQTAGVYSVNGIGVPEPSSLFAIGLFGVGILGRRRKSRIN